jgi:hypothetical protein
VNDTDLDDKIRHFLAIVVESAPASPPFPLQPSLGAVRTTPNYVVHDEQRARPRRRHRWLLVATAAVLLIAVGVMVWNHGSEDSLQPVGPTVTGENIDVDHETWVYTQTSDLTCPDGTVSSGEFSTATFEVWTDEEGGRVRHDVMYPDGSSRSILQAGIGPSAGAPVWSGEARAQVVGCRGVANFLDEPGLVYLENFNAPIGPEGDPTAGPPADQLQRVEDAGTDSSGRPAEVWRFRGGGFIESIGPVHSEVDYFLQPGTGVLLERRFTEEIDGYGSYVQQFTRVGGEETVVDDGIFDPARFTDAGSSDTVPAAEFQEEGTCARGGSASICVVRDGQKIQVKGAGLAPGSSVVVRLRFDDPGLTPGPMEISTARIPVRVLEAVDVGNDGTVDAVVGETNPDTTYVIAGITADAADGYPLNSSIGLRP